MTIISIIFWYVAISLLTRLAAIVIEGIIELPSLFQGRLSTFKFSIDFCRRLISTFFKIELLTHIKIDNQILIIPLSLLIFGDFLGILLQALTGYTVKETLEKLYAVDYIYEKGNSDSMKYWGVLNKSLFTYKFILILLGFLLTMGVYFLPIFIYINFQSDKNYLLYLVGSLFFVRLYFVLKTFNSHFWDLFLSGDFSVDYKSFKLIEIFKTSFFVTACGVLFSSVASIYNFNNPLGTSNNYMLLLPFLIFGVFGALPYFIGIRVTKFQRAVNLEKLSGLLIWLRNIHKKEDKTELVDFENHVNNEFKLTQNRTSIVNTYLFLGFMKEDELLEEVNKKYENVQGCRYFMTKREIIVRQNIKNASAYLPNVAFAGTLSAYALTAKNNPELITEDKINEWERAVEKSKAEIETQKNYMTAIITTVFTGASGYLVKLFDDKFLNFIKEIFK